MRCCVLLRSGLATLTCLYGVGLPAGEGEGRGGSVSDTAPDGDACMAPVSVRRPAQLTVLFSPEKDCVFGTWKAPSDDERHGSPHSRHCSHVA
jgi:hypothetical protein